MTRETIIPGVLRAALLCSAVSINAQGRGLHRLKAWADELPVKGQGAQRRSIFDAVELRGALVRLMGAPEFARMVARFEVTVPADVVDGFLIVTGWPAHDADHGYLVVVKLDTGEVWAAHQGELTVSWYGERAPSRVPECLIEDFLPPKREAF